jgi:putative membrane protein
MQFAAMVVAVIIMVEIVPGIDVDSFVGYVQVAGLMALVNTIVKPIVKLFTAPLILMTLGLIMFVINAALLRLVVGVANDASIDGFGSALVGSIILTLASFAVGWVLSIGEGQEPAAA